jgi:diphosphomevalonate decarboxylase
MPKATVEAPSNIALIKYWGAKDLEQAIPYAPSLSMTLRECRTRTTVEFRKGDERPDEVFVAADNGTHQPAEDDFRDPVVRHLDRLREWADREGAFRVVTKNSFPSAAGIASSASGFAALTLAAAHALGRHPGPTEASVLARRSGSGSAARSVLGGYVLWPDGDETAASQLFPADHWDLRDVIAVVDTEAKAVSSREGHRRAPTSPFFETRLDHLGERLSTVRTALRDRDLTALGEAVEQEGVELHLIAMSSRPPIFYWHPATLTVLEVVRELRDDGIAAYATMDAGANVHVLCPADEEPQVATRLDEVPDVLRTIRDGVGDGPTTDVSPLF